ncbi:hypothetical protein ACLVWU_14000 [Bdellovibrio sp. HCB290]|uniref:hypothetical protein n=1 Tax=Bdellovibrio sp. HCB290 TaxID=3394356 RepID=UPI0039B525D7
MKTTVYNSGVHQVIGIDGPNGSKIYIDLVPGDSSNIGIVNPSPASIGITIAKYRHISNFRDEFSFCTFVFMSSFLISEVSYADGI